MKASSKRTYSKTQSLLQEDAQMVLVVDDEFFNQLATKGIIE